MQNVETDTAAISPAPADSAFTAGTRMLEEKAAGDSFTYTGIQNTEGEIIDAIILALAIVFISLSRKIAGLIPSILGCMVRWKENVNLEDSVKLRLDRNRIWLFSVLPFCIAMSELGIGPHFLGPMSPLPRLAATTGIFITYILVRTVAKKTFRGKKINSGAYNAATNSSLTFFIFCTFLVLSTSGIMSLTSCNEETIKAAVLYEMGTVYAICVWRKTQIFKNTCSLFSAILYLCSLEFLPTALLVASVILL